LQAVAVPAANDQVQAHVAVVLAAKAVEALAPPPLATLLLGLLILAEVAAERKHPRRPDH
jgi:hypothetical protein